MDSETSPKTSVCVRARVQWLRERGFVVGVSMVTVTRFPGLAWLTPVARCYLSLLPQTE